MARRNAEVVLQYSTVYPFRAPGKNMLCVYCCDEYSEPDIFRKHVDEMHKEFTVSTAFAHLGRRKELLKVDITNLRCRVCAEPFETIEEVAEHISQAHVNYVTRRLNLNYEIMLQPYRLIKDKWHCYHCDEKMPTFTKLCRHTTAHYRQHTCDVCGRSYFTGEALKYHVKCVHTGNFVCRKCWQEFPSSEARKDHVKSSKRCWSFACVYCGERFQSWESKNKHLVAKHGCPEVKYDCPDCEAVFHSRKHFYAHYKTTHTDDSFVCTFCGQKFTTKKRLEDHRVAHTGERMFKCPICSKCFMRTKSLAQHMWIHKESKRFVCLLCDKQFAQKVSFKTHMRTHHPEVDLEF